MRRSRVWIPFPAIASCSLAAVASPAQPSTSTAAALERRSLMYALSGDRFVPATDAGTNLWQIVAKNHGMERSPA
jgi:thiamine biosynthesis lipoprotein ApbE